MARQCHCQSCSFSFASGHSHHVGYSWALCTACMTDFVLPTENAWGPRIGEMIVLHKALRISTTTHKQKPPLITFNLEPTEEFLIAESAGEWGVTYPMEHMICPCCGSKGEMAQDFENGRHCPRCRDGILMCDLIEY